MVNAGRVLIIPQGDWSSLEPYQMLDLVTYDKTAYLARKASVGVNPQTDVQKVYWQPFGTAVEIATTEKPGIVMPDGTTITISQTGVIEAHLILGEAEDVDIVNPQNGQVLSYSSILDAWQNKSLGTAASKNSTSSITSGSTDLIESRAVHSLKQTLENKHKVTSFEVNTSGWSANTTIQSGVTLQKKSISLNHVYDDDPSVSIGSASGAVLPSTAQQKAYNLLEYATIDGTTLNLYASDVPLITFYINVEGVD